MGILDEAIREHLELKRQHGAEESEVEGLEAEAFGPADRPDSVDSSPGDSEAMTQVISPGSAVTVPAGEGDQLDKVFEAGRQKEEAAAEEAQGDEPSADEQPSAEEPVIAEPPAAEEPGEATAEGTTAGAAEEASEADGDREADDGQGDAGDALELERQHLAGQPTEHYDVDAAIAEEDEIDLLSESRLADELDRALEGPDDESAAAPSAPAVEDDEVSKTDVAPDVDDAPDAEAEAPESDEIEQDTDDGEFFDQDDPLEGTPDFLEETPEHDRLWFEQKEPKDFDFGD